MSTTDPNSGNPQAGAGSQWPADVAHLSAPDEHGGGGGVNPEAVRAGHEPDAFMVKPIMSIPLAVVVAFVIAFTVAAAVFAYFMGSVRVNPLAHEEAVERGKAPLNEQLARTDRAGLHSNPNREVDQPRLEPLQLLENNGQVTTQTELPSGNPPLIHPEEIMPGRVPGLHQARYVGNDKKFARIPIDDAMKIAVGSKDVLPVRQDQSKPVPSYEKPSVANAGLGVLPASPKLNEKKETPKKKEEPRKGAKEESKSGKAPEPRTKTAEKK